MQMQTRSSTWKFHKVEAGEDEVAMLLKAIYGTVQAARAFGQLFAKIMRKIGF